VVPRLLRACRPGLGAQRGGRYASAAPGLLADLPDFATGSEALASGRYAEAVLPLERASEVASAYFPESAAEERAVVHSALGRCLWYLARFKESAGHYEQGLGAARSASPQAAANLAVAAGRVHFELGSFAAAAKLAAEAVEATPGEPSPILLRDAVEAAQGNATDKPLTALESDNSEDKAVQRLNHLVASALPDGFVAPLWKSDSEPAATSAVLDAELGEGQPLAQLLASSDASPGLTRMALLASAGQLAVAAGKAKEPWARPLLVRALDDFKVLEPGGPTLRPVIFRALGGLGTLTGLTGNFITAEGLFRAALDHADEAAMAHNASARMKIWRGYLFGGYADLLENSRDAEKRASEIDALRKRAAELGGNEAGGFSPEQLRWAFIYLPPPGLLREDAFKK